MPLVGELVTKLTADTQLFDKRIGVATSKIQQFGKTAIKAGAIVATAVATVAVGGFVVLLNTINDTAQEIDDLAKRAKKFGADVASFQRLEYATSLSGVSVGTLNAGMGRLVRSLSSLEQGTKLTVDAFDKLGLSQEKLKGLKIDEVYLLISDRIKGIKDPTEQAKIAVEIFGRSGVEQLNLLRENLSGLAKEFDSFGGSLTNEQAASVEKYNDSLTKLDAVFSVFRLQLTAQVAPALEMIVNWISESTLKFGGLGPLANKVAVAFISGLQIMVSATQGLINFITEIITKFKQLQLAVLQVAQTFNELDFKLFGKDFNFERAEKILKLQGDISKLSKPGIGVTAPLQQGLSSVQGTLQQQTKQQVEVKISTEKGLKAEVAGSQEVITKIKEMLGLITERAD